MTQSGEYRNQYEADGALFNALLALAYFAGKHPVIGVRGSHVTWHCVQVDEHEFNIDYPADGRERLIAWGKAVRTNPDAPAPQTGGPKEGL